jgi:hypothetical protein
LENKLIIQIRASESFKPRLQGEPALISGFGIHTHIFHGLSEISDYALLYSQ